MRELRQAAAPAYALELGGAAEFDVMRDLQIYELYGPECAGLPAAVAALYRSGLRVRDAQPGVLKMFEPGEGGLQPGEVARADAMLAQLGLSAAERTKALDDFGWKVAFIPASSRRVLDLGCGDALEAVLLRARCPAAEITAVDYRQNFSADLERLVGLHFEAAELIEWTANRASSFDAVFTHHTLEHLPNPDRACAAIAAALVPGGTLVATLPLAADPRLRARCRRLARWAEEPKRIGVLDLQALAPRHPWKTNAGDLRATLERAGLSDVRVHQRLDRVSRGLSRKLRRGETEWRWRLRMAVGQPLYNSTFGLLRAALRALGGDRLPRVALRALHSVERRVWFGEMAFSDSLDPDAVTLAVRR